jgi:soluble P-type ATPase
MIHLDIPDFGQLNLDYLVLDFNGTLAVNGRLLPGVADQLNGLAEKLEIVVLTADTFGSAHTALVDVRCDLAVLPPGNQTVGKRDVVRRFGVERCVCVGNGRNDRLMLQDAALGIAVMQAEGTAVDTLMAADIVIPSIVDALALLTSPRRLTATLRA